MAATQSGRRRLLGFALVVIVCIALAVGYAAQLMMRNNAAAAAAGVEFVAITALPASSSGADLMFRSTALGDSFGRVGLAPFGRETNPQRLLSTMQCERVHFAAGVGICLEAKRSSLTSYQAHVFDAKFAVRSSFPLAGPPSRARMSRDGRLAAFTVFVSGHAYDNPGFTTQTSIVDAENGKVVVANLEAMSVERDGAAFKAVDFNFWGVSFASDSNTFYASLGTAGKVYLVRGDLRAMKMQVLHDNVECPSLSPDERRIAFKRRTPMDAAGRRIWRLMVLDLTTGNEVLLGQETRNVDDQVEWLNNREIAYALPKQETTATAGTDVWALTADAATPPRLLLTYAYSPSVLR